MIAFWIEYKPLLVSWFSITTLFIASTQLVNYLKEYKKRILLEEAKAVLEIKNFLDLNEDNFKIHTELEREDCDFPSGDSLEKKKEQVKWYRYLGAIELAGIMWKNGIISQEIFKNQFGYRVENISECKDLMSHIEKDRQYWGDLLDLIRRVKCCSNK